MKQAPFIRLSISYGTPLYKMWRTIPYDSIANRFTKGFGSLWNYSDDLLKHYLV